MPASPRDLTFISYSHKDKVWLDKLLDTLKPLVRKGSVTVWADTQIRPGDQWRDEIKSALSSTKVAILLVSTNFLASDFIAKHELPPLLKKAKAGGLTVLWVHLSSSLYEETGIEDYQAAHDIAKPLDSLSESEQAKALVEIARKIRDAVARKEEDPSPDGAQEAIKGLRPFRHEDADIFARLGRQREVEDYARTIADREFRFGILSGESGCGKSSFLQAGLWPKMETYRVPHRCVYVKFSNEDPFETLKRAVSKSLEIPFEDLRQLDLLVVLQATMQANTKPLLLLFDQFEQFFVHRKLKQDREPFLLALTDWYRNGTDLPVKILVCIRGDFSDRLAELQYAMGYSIGPAQNVRLEKFEPQDAAKVIKQIAEVEGLPVEERFVESMVKELADREDGLISPAYLQIMAWVLSRQKEAEKREFTSKAFQKLGGVEGLLDRFLSDSLDARSGDASKQAVLKILVALIDLDRNTRAGLMTVEALQEKLKDTLKPEAIPEAVEWLASPEVRLITPQEQQGGMERREIAYELAHECLIPAVRKLAGKQLSEADRANQILDRRVNEWLGNDRHPSYLLGWRDWRLIERNWPYLIWGEQRNQKEQLLAKTKRRWQWRAVAADGIVLLLLGVVAGWLSPWGQIQMVKWDLANLSKGNDQAVLKVIADALPSVGEFEWAAEVASRIEQPGEKARALASVAEAAAHVGNVSQAKELLQRAVAVTQEITPPRAKYWRLMGLARVAARVGNISQANQLLQQAVGAAKEITDPNMKALALSAIARDTGAIWNAEVQKQAEAVASEIKEPNNKAEALEAVAQGAVQMGDVNKATALLHEVAVLKKITEPRARGKAWALEAVVGTMVREANAGKNIELLKQAEMVAREITGRNEKAAALEAVAKAAAQMARATKNMELLKQAEVVAGEITERNEKAAALKAVAEVAAQMGDGSKATALLLQELALAWEITELNENGRALVAVAHSVVGVGDVGQANDLLEQVVAVTKKITEPHAKARALTAVAQAASATKNMELLKQVTVLAKEIARLQQGYVLKEVAEAMAKVANSTMEAIPLNEAVAVAEEIPIPGIKARALGAVAQAAVQLASDTQDAALLKQLVAVAEKISDLDKKARVLKAASRAAARLGHWRRARHYAGLNLNHDERAKALIGILQVWHGVDKKRGGSQNETEEGTENETEEGTENGTDE